MSVSRTAYHSPWPVFIIGLVLVTIGTANEGDPAKTLFFIVLAVSSCLYYLASIQKHGGS